MDYVPGTSAIDQSAMGVYYNNGVGNSAYSSLYGPVNIDTGYEFGDWITGKGAAKQQAAAQAQLDFAEYQRNEASAKAQRQWEEYMDNTKVQRSMADLKAAGFNPWLAVQSAGFGGSVPSGSSASSSAGQVSSSGNPLMGMASAAVGIAALVKAIAKIVK